MKHLTEDGKFTEKEIDWLHFNCVDEVVDKILENEEDSEKYKELKQRLDKYGEVQLIDNLAGTDSILARRQKNQEMAKQWQIYLDGGMNNLFDIHERLKKRIEEYDRLSDSDYKGEQVRDELQKILGEENGN